MKKRKIILTSLALALVLVIGGIAAYLTDATQTETNTFTVGKVDITLTEPSWVAANGQEIVPGQVIAKDPTITVAADSKDAFIFMEVTIPTGTVAGTANTELFKLLDSEGNVGVNSGWTLVSKTGNTYVYGYGAASAMEAVSKNTTKTLFNSVKFVDNITSAEATALTGNQNITVKGYAIQATDLGTTEPSAVWALAH